MQKFFFFRFKLHYVLALAAFCAWMLYFDEKDVFTQQRRRTELKKLEDKAEWYRQQIAETRQTIEDLGKDPAMLEKFAREKYFMKRDNEEVFVFSEETPTE